MKKGLINNFGNAVKPALLRYFYYDLICDFSSSKMSSQNKVDLRMKQAIEMEDPDIVTDFQHLNTGAKVKYDPFAPSVANSLSKT